MTKKEDLLSKSISESPIRIYPTNKNYTIPRTYGVYEILKITNAKRFRFGNHPVRENKLVKEFDSFKRIGLFLGREDAKKFADFLSN